MIEHTDMMNRGKDRTGRLQDDGRAEARTNAEYGKVRLKKPLDLNLEDTGGDPYNSTGRFSRVFR